MLFDDIIAEFLALAEVPRPSFFTERVQAYLLDFAKVNGLEAEADRAGNVRILKTASAGRENEPLIRTWSPKRLTVWSSIFALRR